MKKKTLEISILVVDDSADTRELIRRQLSLKYSKVITAQGVEEAIALLQEDNINLVITDLKLKNASGLELVRYVRENFRNIGIMMITGYATIEGAVTALKLGVEEYLPKPFTNAELTETVHRLIQKIKSRENGTFTSEGEKKYGIIGNSQAMQDIFSVIERASRTLATVLITGESGTGKELITRAIHYHSKRSSAPFVPINCTAIPENLLESELFGYIKGAFTGANTSRAGFFQTASGGTIFLDEIGEMSLGMQAKLLRVIQEKEVYLVGSRKPISVDVRIISATNKELRSLVEKGLFREDLYYRLNVINIEIPPLRDREDDVFLLISYFMRRYALEMSMEQPQISEDALNILRNYPWPGNVRELDNLVQRLLVMSDDDIIKPADLPPYMKAVNNDSRKNLHKTLLEVEREHIKTILNAVAGNKSEAARILNIDRKTLRSKLQES